MIRITAVTVAAAVGLSAAQEASFRFSGTVVGVSGDIDVVAVGDAATGGFAFDLGTPQFGPGEPLLGDFAFYEALTISAEFEGVTFSSESPVAVVANDISLTGGDPVGGLPPVDALVVGGGLVENETRTGQVTFNFVGDAVWFDGVALPAEGSIGLENLLTASVLVDLETFVVGPFDENGDLLPPDQWVVETARIEVQIDAILNDGALIAAVGCPAATIARPVARADFADVTGFIAAFNAANPDADVNGDGFITFEDATSFIAQFPACGN